MGTCCSAPITGMAPVQSVQFLQINGQRRRVVSRREGGSRPGGAATGMPSVVTKEVVEAARESLVIRVL